MGARRRKCLCCGQLFRADPRNLRHQRYCSAPACRKASKAASQGRWLARNPEYFKGPEHVVRVQAWRAAHPGYGGRRRAVRARRYKTTRCCKALIVQAIRPP